ncbi:hypothetical protein KIL84_020389 [Mauremys mutica]|uniref:Uncharacterized protein n=1 Tax=Mauremys mutica TaxID=74926 RepID=A0A9D3XYK1_9SAUR|nr:hypothetical protein KIL84_020389 [Mauremys mutica]
MLVVSVWHLGLAIKGDCDQPTLGSVRLLLGVLIFMLQSSRNTHDAKTVRASAYFVVIAGRRGGEGVKGGEKASSLQPQNVTSHSASPQFQSNSLSPTLVCVPSPTLPRRQKNQSPRLFWLPAKSHSCQGELSPTPNM